MVRAGGQGGAAMSAYEGFSLTEGEVDAVHWAAAAVSEAAKAGDEPRRKARFADLCSILLELRQRYGTHPLFFELEADFTQNPRDAADLYVWAERTALLHGLPTLSIRLSLARLLIEELGRSALGRETLLACQDELPLANERQCAAWNNLLAKCTSEEPPAPAEPGAPEEALTTEPPAPAGDPRPSESPESPV